MLKSYIQARQCPKFVIIEDSLEERGDKILDFIAKHHTKEGNTQINYYVFEGKFDRIQKSSEKNSPNIQFYNYTDNLENPVCYKAFLKILNKCGKDDVLILDSLAKIIYRYNETTTYKILNNLIFKTSVKQVITLLHRDLLKNFEQTSSMFRNLSTLYLSIRPKFVSENSRISYIYKKQAGKIIADIEEYRFDGDNFITEKINIPSLEKMEQVVSSNEINPENLSTFRIGLSETEKESRANLILPYLPHKNETENTKSDGEIFYTLDAADDWDEEDPDDDLDF